MSSPTLTFDFFFGITVKIGAGCIEMSSHQIAHFGIISILYVSFNMEYVRI